ncbi:methyltransferase domain-containing protein [Phytoactinopolyspora alkaliphila]|uniref:Methyltransferase domain-containing protein n=1 Tax=Phytoactinopolyspora alkaliphila TaxID=1783498 RepID=A0A6N9YJI3_9ACTN|nr:methyltransferase domain-containing protein [Phytoactinopolyspora alkaliphila]NED95058.1 methyltransferase domain-containing protein [Phytoactinopolyspora alkaliphila]
MWDPDQYLTFADQRSRPFHDLVAQVRPGPVRHVVDLGCGPGGLTAGLAARWPGARIVGVDSSAEMIERAGRYHGAEFVHADLRSWEPDGPVDVLLSNATLQWVSGHLGMLARLASFIAAGGWLAFQVPANFGEPSHVELRDLAASPRWAGRLEVTWPAAHEPEEYLDALLDLGLAAEVWETTYHHLLPGPDDVLEWVRGSALRPVLDLLDDDEQAEFTEAYRARLHAAYPVGVHGTLLHYRRVFAVAHR